MSGLIEAILAGLAVLIAGPPFASVAADYASALAQARELEYQARIARLKAAQAEWQAEWMRAQRLAQEPR